MPRSVSETAFTTIYEQSVDVGSTVTSGTAVTLPAAGSYVGDELEITLNGQVLDSGVDWNTVGSGTKTQVSYTFDLLAGDHIRYKIIRGP